MTKVKIQSDKTETISRLPLNYNVLMINVPYNQFPFSFAMFVLFPLQSKY